MNHTTNHATGNYGNHFVAPEHLADIRLARLLKQHSKLEANLNDELRHPHIDWDGVKLIKRQKLAVTEQLVRLRRARLGVH
jgi:hypothetical protein